MIKTKILEVVNFLFITLLYTLAEVAVLAAFLLIIFTAANEVNIKI